MRGGWRRGRGGRELKEKESERVKERWGRDKIMQKKGGLSERVKRWER